MPSKPRGSARSSRRLLRREREGRKIFGSSEDRAGDYVHGATMRVDRGRLRGSTDLSFHLEEAAQAQCRLAHGQWADPMLAHAGAEAVRLVPFSSLLGL